MQVIDFYHDGVHKWYTGQIPNLVVASKWHVLGYPPVVCQFISPNVGCQIQELHQEAMATSAV